MTDFDVADASSGETGPRDKALVIIRKMVTNKVIMIIALISLCSGFLRQGILKWYRSYGAGIGVKGTFVFDHWGMVSCIAGITGGIFAGVISDHVFHSRRPPVATVLFAFMLAGSIAIVPLLPTPVAVSWVIGFMAVAIIGVHGMLSGVASQDFGGRRNAGTATGLIDGFVYFGTALQSFIYGHMLPEGRILVDGVWKPNPAAHDVANWYGWPIAMIPIALIGLALSLSIWNARVQPKPPATAPVRAAELPTAKVR
jgi:OPA family glycerol-3-phosphate transporter-like MFS transporter